VNYLAKAVKNLPGGFYDSLRYTRTGNNLTHPITWGLLTDFVRQKIVGTTYIGIDVRLNTGSGTKFQPDIVAFGGEIAEPSPLLFIDYESPNSSDGRPISKDIVPYLAWCEKTASSVPYIVITTLPNKKVEEWSKWDCVGNADYQQLKLNPYDYWYPWYKEEIGKRISQMTNVALLNINGTLVKREFPL
jgi:hypothetical protein